MHNIVDQLNVYKYYYNLISINQYILIIVTHWLYAKYFPITTIP